MPPHDRNANSYVMLGTFNLPVNIMDPQQIQVRVSGQSWRRFSGHERSLFSPSWFGVGGKKLQRGLPLFIVEPEHWVIHGVTVNVCPIIPFGNKT